MPMHPQSGRARTATPATGTDPTTVGKPGVAVARIEREGATYTLRQTVGAQSVTLNDQPLRPEGTRLNDGDVIELAGTRVLFVRG